MKKRTPPPPRPFVLEVSPPPAPKKPPLSERLRAVLEETDREDSASERSRYALLKLKLRGLVKS